jgi:hypothetical protein
MQSFVTHNLRAFHLKQIFSNLFRTFEYRICLEVSTHPEGPAIGKHGLNIYVVSTSVGNNKLVLKFQVSLHNSRILFPI